MKTVEDFVAVIVALRWVLVALGLLVLGGLYVDVLGRLRATQRYAEQLANELADAKEDRARLLQMLAERQRRAAIVALRPRQEVPRG